MKRRRKKKTVVLSLFKTLGSPDPIVSIDSRIKILAEMVEEMNGGKKRFSLEELIQQLDVLLIQLQTNGGDHYARRK